MSDNQRNRVLDYIEKETKIFNRCMRELSNSKNLTILSNAKKYYELFLKQCSNSNVYRNRLDRLYRNVKQRLS